MKEIEVTLKIACMCPLAFRYAYKLHTGHPSEANMSDITMELLKEPRGSDRGLSPARPALFPQSAGAPYCKNKTQTERPTAAAPAPPR